MQATAARIGLLATGEELTQGDILNTNGQSIARQLADQGFNIGSHVIVGDSEADIKSGIQFLLNDHQVLIITGGLGPTSDDRTRFALSSAINKPLVLDEISWQNIVARIRRFGFEAHESNKQQALFPEDAEIIANPHGTAPGCRVNLQEKVIYMLPGPPRECLPMFATVVLPMLLQMGIQNNLVYKKWRLFSVNESEIAAKLDKIVAPYQGVTGYRWDYPYLEFKLYIAANADIVTLLAEIEAAIAQHIICDADATALQLLQRKLSQYQGKIAINDTATGGLLQAMLLTPETQHSVCFTMLDHSTVSQPLLVCINKLDEYWQAKPMTGETELEVIFIEENKQEKITQLLPYRSTAIRQYAVEYVSYLILNYLARISGLG